MDDQKYMNGRGVLRRTRELTDQMWDGLIGAWLGTSLAFVGPLFSWLYFINRQGFSNDPPIITHDIFLAVILGIACVLIGILVSLPWHSARYRLQKHRRALQAENAKRGNGWAYD